EGSRNLATIQLLHDTDEGDSARFAGKRPKVFMSANKNALHIALIGFGEVGRRFADDLMGTQGLSLSTFDILRNDDARRGDYERAAAARQVATRDSAKSACEGAHLIISA